MFVEITDVFLRDGLQDQHVVVGTAEKLAVAASLYEAGVPRLEAGSFVNPRKVPQMADTAELFAARPAESAVWTGLALNAQGINRALDADVDQIQVVASASDAHSAANAGGGTARMLADLSAAIAESGVPVAERFFAGISTAFTCPFEGDVPAGRVIELVRGFRSAGISTIGLADTLGTTPPEKVIDTVIKVRAAVPDVVLSLHLHNADGQALETVTLALEQGITRFDSALAGFGGCPFAPGAAGNLDTLELIRHLHALGHETGIDEVALEKLGDRARELVRAARPIPA